MYKILITDSLAEAGIKILEKEKKFNVVVKTKLSPDELKKEIKDADALIIRSGTKATAEVIKAADKLKVIGRAGVGLDNVDVEAASKKGIIAMNTPSGNTISTAEHAMSLILSLSRRIPQANASLQAKKWERKKFMGVELYGKALGIIGLGRIGTEVARRASSFGMKILAYDPFLSSDKAGELNIQLADLNEVLKKSDYITIHTPLTDETKNIISTKAFKMMKKTAYIVNAARGGVIDEKALATAVKSGEIAGAALDVFEKEPPFESPALGVENIIVTPHLGASTEEAQINVAIEVAEQVRDALLYGSVRNAVNFPSLDAETARVLKPFVSLAEKLGQFEGQVAEGRLKKVSITYTGEIVNYNLKPLTISVVKGLLSPILGETVNYVNALVIADERNIKIAESESGKIKDFANLISVQVETEKGKTSIEGTLFTKVDPRIVKIGQFYVDAIPSGNMVLISNRDVPGIVGQIGTILGKNKINIAGMSFGREIPGKEAISILNVDSVISSKVLNEIKKAKDLLDAKVIKL